MSVNIIVNHDVSNGFEVSIIFRDLTVNWDYVYCTISLLIQTYIFKTTIIRILITFSLFW